MPAIRIQTAQNVVVEYEIASVGDRILATLIDWAVYVGYFGVLLWLMSSLDTRPGYFGSFLLYLPVFLYPVAAESLYDGRTLGKHARDIRVVKRSGAAPGIGDFLLRWLLTPIDLMGGLGLIIMLVSPNGQRLGDLTAGTVVVKQRPRTGPYRSAFEYAPDAAAEYQVLFPEAARLTDRDASLLRRILAEADRRRDRELLDQAIARVRDLTGITDARGQSGPQFLRTLLRDHAWLAAQEEGVQRGQE
jgi:uncharacterized RDD family membrane protein YckC